MVPDFQRDAMFSAFRAWRLLPLLHQSKREVRQASIVLWHEKVRAAVLRAWRKRAALLARCRKLRSAACARMQRHVLAAWRRQVAAGKKARKQLEAYDQIVFLFSEICGIKLLGRCFGAWRDWIDERAALSASRAARHAEAVRFGVFAAWRRQARYQRHFAAKSEVAMAKGGRVLLSWAFGTWQNHAVVAGGTQKALDMYGRRCVLTVQATCGARVDLHVETLCHCD